MSDEENIDSNESQETPAALVNADGSFAENWKESLPEDIRHEKILDNLGDFHGTMKQLVHAQRMIGKNKVVIPDDKSPDSDWDVFYNAIGRPKTVGDYKFVKDENLPEELYDDGMISRFLEGAHKVGFTQKQMDYLNQFENERIKMAQEAYQNQKIQDKAEAERAVKALWGAAYPEMDHLANLFVNETTEEGADRDSILDIIGNNPVIANWCAQNAKKYIAEHKAVIGQMTTPTPKEAMAEIADLQNTEGYMTGELYNKNPAKHNQIKARIQELYEIANKGS